MTQYFQFVRGYGPLSTGVHLLPVALSVGIGSVAGTQLAVRVGTKLVVTVGLVAMAAFYGPATGRVNITAMGSAFPLVPPCRTLDLAPRSV